MIASILPVAAGFATAAACTVLLSADAALRRRGRVLLGRVERWNDDSTADATWYLLGLPLVRQRWTHSTWLAD